MSLRCVPLLALLAASACYKDETISGYGAADHVWRLTEIDGSRFDAPATLRFPEPGRISGNAPCNSFGAEQTAPYPWFKAGPIAATRMACADLPAEARFLEALEAMTLAEIQGDVLILSNDAGREMVFTAEATE